MRGKLRQPRSAYDQVGWLRRRHRPLGLWVVFVTFTFALSASYHLWQKFSPNRRDQVARINTFTASELTWPLAEALGARCRCRACRWRGWAASSTTGWWA
ncbi:MAG: hypothetical protein ACRYFK_05020 [Janthinobacterium lividum]